MSSIRQPSPAPRRAGAGRAHAPRGPRRPSGRRHDRRIPDGRPRAGCDRAAVAEGDRLSSTATC